MTMKSLTLAYTALLGLSAGTCFAAIEATSRLDIENFSINIQTGAVAEVTEIRERWRFRAALETVTPGYPLEVATSGSGLDGSILSYGTAVADGAFPAHGTLATPYVFADSEGGGSIVAPGGASVSTMASLGADSSLPLRGASSANDQLQVLGIRIDVPTALTFSFDALLNLSLTNNGSSPPFAVTAGSTYTIVISGGTDAGVPFLYSSTADATLGIGALNNNAITLAGSGASILGPQVNGSFESGVITLNPGDYLLQINQTSFASLVALPEPTTVVVWGLLASGAFGLGAGRRERA